MVPPKDGPQRREGATGVLDALEDEDLDLLGATGLGEADALPPPPQGAPYCDKHDALQ